MTKKAISYVIFSFTIILFLLLMYVSVTMMISRKNHDFTFIFNRAISTVGSDSMNPDLKKGDFIIIKDMDYDTYFKRVKDNPGNHVDKDWIVYYNASENRLIVHQLYEVYQDQLQTKGISNPSPDTVFVTKENFRGIVTSDFRMLGIGNKINNNRFVIFLMVVGLFAIFVMREIRNIFKLLLEKNQETRKKALEAELEQFRAEEKERLLSEKMQNKIDK